MIADKILARFTQLPGARRLWVRFPFGSVDTRVRYDIWSRPHYAYGVYTAAQLAKRLDLSAISVLELGVAGGRGLLALADLAEVIGRHVGIEITVVGFDSGKGMPEPTDYRDLPHVWGKGFYAMDQAQLQSQLQARPSSAELILGDVEETIPAWLGRPDLPPIGFVAFDLDYYSSTIKAFRLFEPSDPAVRLPRVYCYFDDTVWPERACHNDYVGELGAIREFNGQHADKKICPIHLFRFTRIHPAAWNEQMYVLHDFKHPLYCRNITPPGEEYSQLPL
jgi:hypothetical protein